jgi:hypothetical protein
MDNMEMVKERTLEAGQMVFVYFNLHKKLFSVKDVKTGLVVAHTNQIELKDATFKVSEAGRQRVLREKKKNVHAGVAGYFVGADFETAEGMTQLTYNPYKYDSFVVKESEQVKVKRASKVQLIGQTIWSNGWEGVQ